MYQKITALLNDGQENNKKKVINLYRQKWKAKKKKIKNVLLDDLSFI